MRRYFSGYDIPKMLSFVFIFYSPRKKTLKWKLKQLLKLFYAILIKDYTIDNYKYENSILYADRFIKLRADIERMVEKIGNSFGGKYDRLRWKISRSFSMLRFIQNIQLCLQFTYLLKVYSFFDWMFLMKFMIAIKDVGDELDRKVQIERYKLCFCYYDAETYQNFIMQYANKHGCNTATLQHGIMLAPRMGLLDNSDFDGHEFRDSVSKYFLIWNNFTKEEALKYGIPEKKLKVLGVAKCIGFEQIIPSFASPYIGIFLDGELEKQNNEPLITIVQEWARFQNKKCVFRYHPHFRGDEYDELMDSTVSRTCDKSLSLYDFIESVSFCVVANSTVLFELEYFCVPFLRYSSNDELDKYKDYPSLNFSSVKSFNESYNKMRELPKKEFVKADKNYEDFFKQFVN